MKFSRTLEYRKIEETVYSVVDDVRSDFLTGGNFRGPIKEISDRLKEEGLKANYDQIERILKNTKIDGEQVFRIEELKVRKFVGYTEDWDSFYKQYNSVPQIDILRDYLKGENK